MVCCEPIVLRYSDGYRAFARLWMPLHPTGAVLYLHGIQSHGAWFEASARFLANSGLAVLLPDRRGSGRNEADRGHATSVRRWLRDCSEALDELHIRTSLDRFHVVGVSWGGKLALGLYRFAPERIASVSLIAPGLFPRVDLPFGDKIRVGLSAMVGGRAQFEIPLNEPTMFTGNPAWQKFIQEDPHRLRKVTASFLICSRRLDRYAVGVVKSRPGVPLRLFLAGTDPVIDNQRTRQFVRQLPWPDRQVIEYPQGHHTLEFERDPSQFFTDLLTGLVGQLVP